MGTTWRRATAAATAVVLASLIAIGAATAQTPGLQGRIVFHTALGGNSDIWVMNADVTGRTRLTEDRDSDYNPEFSPDGSRIAFVSDRGRSRDVWVMNADGTGQQQLTQDLGDDISPTFSPTGSRSPSRATSPARARSGS